jgi:hypothetical protein
MHLYISTSLTLLFLPKIIGNGRMFPKEFYFNRLNAGICMVNLSPQQRNIYLFINQYCGEHGYSPSRNEIAANVNIHPSTVREHLVS